MSKIKLVISDLHLADGHPILDCFGEQQQSAFEGLLAAAYTGGSLGGAEDVELIINGDCFDFLTVPPYGMHGTIDASTSVGKLEKIISAHGPFFETLERFTAQPGRHVTFMTGNHDIELVFEVVCSRICQAISSQRDQGVDFCRSCFYRPLPDVYIEHGNQYDFWNHTSGIWDEYGQPLQPEPGAIMLPVGTQYFQRAAHPISIQYPYFDHFDPSMDSMSQIALLSLLNPSIVLETAQCTMELLSYPRKPLAGLSAGEEHVPTKLFEHAMRDFAAFYQDMLAQKPDWVEPAGNEHTEADTMAEFTRLHDALTLPLVEAVSSICTPRIYRMGESVALGMKQVLSNDPTLRYSIAGHTHMNRIDPTNNGSQVYLNTATWTKRYALPGPGEVTPGLAEWFNQPDWDAIPLKDLTELVFALIYAEDGKPSSASLCAWEDGVKGSYRVLA
jgi:UDP-2,3-diacylglucosamine pyrophosphatase LpxH